MRDHVAWDSYELQTARAEREGGTPGDLADAHAGEVEAKDFSSRSLQLRGSSIVLMGISRFKRFFRAAAGLDVHKDDLRRYSNFVNRKVYDLLLISQATAKANGRDVIEPWELPITKVLPGSVRLFERIDEEVELRPILERLAALPPLDLAYSEETEARLSGIVGGLSLSVVPQLLHTSLGSTLC